MKKILTSALAIALFMGAVNAQSNTKGKHKEKKNDYEMAIQNANLSIEQQDKIKIINEDYRKQVVALKTQNLSAAQMKEKKETLHKEHKMNIEAILTEEQKTTLLKERQEQRKEGNGMKKDTTGRGTKSNYEKGQRGEKAKEMAEDLDLSIDQKAKIQTIRASYKTRLSDLRNDTLLSKEEKKEKMKELMKAQQEEIRGVLTAEQQSKMKGMRKDVVKRK